MRNKLRPCLHGVRDPWSHGFMYTLRIPGPTPAFPPISLWSAKGGGEGVGQGNLFEGQPYQSFLRRRGVYFCRRETEEKEKGSPRFSSFPSFPARFLFSWYWDTQPEHLQRRETSQRIRVPLIVHEFRLRPDAGRNVRLFDHNVFLLLNQRYIWPLVYSHSYVTDTNFRAFFTA